MVQRRDVLRGLGAGTATVLGAGAASTPATAGKSGDCEDVDFSTPHIATADHFDTTWYGSVYLTDGNSATNYDMGGSGFPWGADELVLHVHGWQNDYECGVSNVEQAQAAYAHYGAGVSGLAWGSDYAWWNSKEIADRTGPKLANFLHTLNWHYPETTVRVQGHSQGAHVLCETIKTLDDWGVHDAVDTAIFLAGAVVDEEVSLGGTYGPALERSVGHVENYWDDDDSVLNWAFQTYEWSGAIGNNGVSGTPPANYTDHEVTGYVDSHYTESYVIPEFVNDWILPQL